MGTTQVEMIFVAQTVPLGGMGCHLRHLGTFSMLTNTGHICRKLGRKTFREHSKRTSRV